MLCDKKSYALKFIIILWAGSFLNVACSERKQNATAQYHIEVNTERDSLVKSSSLFNNISILALETKEGALIGSIDKLLFDEKKIFVIDKNISQAIFIFNDKGEFVNKIDKRGKAPGEFTTIRDVTLDTKNKLVWLLDQALRKVSFYGYDGKFVESKSLPFLFSSFAYIDSSSMAFDIQTAINKDRRDVNNHYLITGDLEGNIFNRAFRYGDDERNFTFWNSIQLRRFDDQILYQPRFGSTVFQIMKDEVRPIFYLDFKNKKFPDEDEKITSDQRFIELRNQYSYFNGEYVNLKKLACFAVNTPEGRFYLLYSKETGKSILVKSLLIETFSSGFFHPPFERFGENTVVTFAHAHQIISAARAHSVSGEDEFSEHKLFRELTENDNPVLFFYDLKYF